MLAPEVDVLVDRQLRHQVQLLVDHGDAAVDGFAGVVEGHGLVIEQHLAVELRVDPAHDLHEGGLACPVLTDQAMDLAHVHVE